jgi:tetratricopeptide (TPR) repeat protein
VDQLPMNLTLLGKTELRCNEGSIVQLPTKKVFLLLAILAMNPGIQISRSSLVEAIWPNSQSDAARTSLRNALAALRKVLPRQWLDTTDDHICLSDSGLLCDALKEIDANMPHGGDFMPTFSEDWVLDQRLVLRRDAVRVRLEQAINFSKVGEDLKALSYLEDACHIDPLCQEAAMLRVQFLEELGKTPEAAMAANTFHSKVLRELGVVINIETPQKSSDSNPLTVTCDWLVDRNPQEAASFLVGTRSSWTAMGGKVALDYHRKVLDAYPQKTQIRTLVEAQHLYLRWVVGDFDHSSVETQTAFACAMARHDLETANILGTALSFGFLSQGNFKESIRHSNLVLDLAGLNGDPLEIGNKAIILHHLGREGSWEIKIKDSLRVVEDFGTPDDVAQHNSLMAMVMLKEGKLEPSSTYLARARRYYESTGGRRMIGYSLFTQAMIQEETGDYLQAIETVNQIQDLGPDVLGHSLSAGCNDLQARLQSRVGELDKSAEAVARGTLIRRHFGSSPSIFEISQLNPTRRLLKERLNKNDLRAAFARAKSATDLVE